MSEGRCDTTEVDDRRNTTSLAALEIERGREGEAGDGGGGGGAGGGGGEREPL